MIVTTAINYTNGDPHIGHCYEAILADVYVRYRRLFSSSRASVFFQTGTDEHGQKIADKAAQLGSSPKDLCDLYSNKFKELDRRLQIDYDHFIRTTDDYHKKEVIRLFDVLKDQGDIYLGSYEGWYNTREETFVTEHDAALSKYIDHLSQKPLVQIKEPSYFFCLKKYLPVVLDFLEQNRDFIVPTCHHNEICIRLRKLIDEGADDLSISRTKLSWGIPIPNPSSTSNTSDTSETSGTAEKHCLYVWMDALLNYHTGPLHRLGNNYRYDEMIHVIGKDILWFHAVIWLAFLKALKFRLPKQIYVHDFIVDKTGVKMSKSIGNVVDPVYLLDKYGTNATRFYFIKETTLGMDLRFSEEALAQCIPSELGSKLGNVVNRVLSITGRYVGGLIPENSETNYQTEEIFDALGYYRKIEIAVKEYRLSVIVEYLQEMIHRTNQHLMKTEIWKIKDEEKLKQVAPPLIRMYLEAILIIAQFFEPIMPEISTAIFKALNYSPTLVRSEAFLELAKPNQLNKGSKVETRLILFPQSK